MSQALPVPGKLLTYQQLQRATFLRHAGVITASSAAAVGAAAAAAVVLHSAASLMATYQKASFSPCTADCLGLLL